MGPVETRRRVLAQVLVCRGCCCGRTDKGKPEVPVNWLKREWKQRGLLKRVHLTVSGCLGPCDLPNVVCVATPQGLEWLGNVAEPAEYEALLGWAEACAAAGSLLPLPDSVAAKRFCRF